MSQITFNNVPIGIAIQRSIIFTLEMGISQYHKNKQIYLVAEEEEEYFLEGESSGEDAESDK